MEGERGSGGWGSSRTTGRSWTWPCWTLLLGCLGIFAVGVLVRAPRPDPLLDVGVYNVVHLLAAVLCWSAPASDRREVLAWRCVAAGLALTLVGNLVFSSALSPLTYPSWADLLYLAAFPLRCAGVLLLTRSRVRTFLPSMWLDGLVAGLGVGGVAVAALLGPLLEVSGDSRAVVLVNLSYPGGDLLLLAVVVGCAAALGLRADRSLVWLSAALLVTFAADVAYLLQQTAGTYVEGALLDLVWLVGVSALAAGAQASRRSRRRTAPDPAAGDDDTRASWQLLALPAVASSASVVLLALGWGGGMPPAAGVCAAACTLVAGARAVLTFHEIRDLPEVRRQARTDDLTGLANRRALLERCDELLGSGGGAGPARGDVPPSALLLLDLDGFKEVNDSLGHQAGDELLDLVGRRLSTVLRPGDLLARLGGDEFAALLPATDAATARSVAEDLRASLEPPFALGAISLHVRASTGVATAPEPAATRTELLRCADVAMYQSKVAGDGSVVVFAPDPGAVTGERLRTTEEVRVALAEGHMVVHLQPQVDLREGVVVGFEALVRWQHPSRGLLLPGSFLEHLERAGLQRQLADVVLEASLTAVARLRRRGVHLPVAINLSPADVSDLDLPERIARRAAQHGVPLELVAVEVTEHTVMRDHESARRVLARLRDRGVRVSIDDYGTGYSSLSYLRHLPADELKLDRAFTVDVVEDATTRAIVRSTVALAHDLGLSLVAEGVETRSAADVLAELGCDVAQGYHYARPMPVDQLVPWMDERHPPVEEVAVPGPGRVPPQLVRGDDGRPAEAPVRSPAAAVPTATAGRGGVGGRGLP